MTDQGMVFVTCLDAARGKKITGSNLYSILICVICSQPPAALTGSQRAQETETGVKETKKPFKINLLFTVQPSSSFCRHFLHNKTIGVQHIIQGCAPNAETVSNLCESFPIIPQIWKSTFVLSFPPLNLMLIPRAPIHFLISFIMVYDINLVCSCSEFIFLWSVRSFKWTTL